MSLSIIQRVDREISYGPLAPDHYLSGLRLTGIVDLSQDLEAVELVLTYASEGEGKGSEDTGAVFNIVAAESNDPARQKLCGYFKSRQEALTF